MGEHYDHRVVLRAANGNITSDVAYPNFTLAKPAFDLLSGKLREGETVTFHPAAGRGTMQQHIRVCVWSRAASCSNWQYAEFNSSPDLKDPLAAGA